MVDVTVVTAGGTSATSSADQFSYTPVVTGISPAAGLATGGTTVTITGTGFTGATAVDFGSTKATSFTVVSDTEITAISPAGTGVVDVTVVTPGGTSATSSADQFTYVALLPTWTTLQVSASTITYEQTETLTATVTASGSMPSGGTVTFFNGSVSLGTAPLNSGTATLQVSTLPVGTDLLTASYSGSGNFAGSSTAIGPNSIITTVAGNGTTYSGDEVPPPPPNWATPIAVAVDAAGDIFIADACNARIREVNHLTGAITTVAGNGIAGYSGDGGPATAAELDYPRGRRGGRRRRLSSSPTGNNVIREVNLSTGMITTVAGNGTHGLQRR